MRLNLKDFLPLDNEIEDHTFYLQQAIDKLHEYGGGTLIINSGCYKISTIVLYSNICIELEPSAILIASGNIAKYDEKISSVVAENSQQALFFAKNAQNITIKGMGTIDGNANKYHATKKEDNGYIVPNFQRPRIIVFENCKNVKLNGFSIQNAPMWTVHLIASQHIFIDNLIINNSLDYSNTDAIDIDSCQYVHINNCHIKAADDCICIKTSKMPKEMEEVTKDIVINNCTLESKSCAIKVGTESFRDISNISVSNSIISNSNRAIGLVSRDGGDFSNFIFKGIIIETAHTSACHWGKADPLYISIYHRDPSIEPGVVRNVIFSDIIISSEGAINFHGEPQIPIKNVSLNNINMTLKPSNATDRGCYDIRPPCNPSNPTGEGKDNAYSINKVTGKAYNVYQYPDGMPIIYAAYVKGLNITNANLSYAEPKQKYWNNNKIVKINCE